MSVKYIWFGELMRIDEIIGILKENIFLAVVGLLAMAVLMGTGYFVVYKKVLRGRKRLAVKDMVMLSLIAGYIMLVIGITFLQRNSFYGQVNLHFLSSYKTAWNSFEVRSWQFLIFNIIMFVPLGILLPIAHKGFRKISHALAAGLALTCLIEVAQLITAFGIFELDDIFNNLLGTLVGYSIVMTVINLKKDQSHRYRKAFAYFSPFLITTALFAGMFTYYNLKEFGNLSENYDYKLNMKNVNITSDMVFGSEGKTVPVYKAPTLNKDSALMFVVSFFENINVDTSNIEVMDYYEEAVYWSRGDNKSSSYSIWINNLDGSYKYTDFSFFDDDIANKSASEKIISEKLKLFGIDIPEEATLISREEGSYEFTIDKNVVGNTMTHGSLYCAYYSDDTIKNIRNNFVVYEKARDAAVISEKEAYEKVTEGKFRYGMYADKIDTVEIKDISLDYRLDSKGYLQPVYIFNSIINDEPYPIIIPALS